jgi:hypothetical protein
VSPPAFAKCLRRPALRNPLLELIAHSEKARELIPDIPFLKFDFVAFEKGAEFILKGSFFMVFALFADVLANLFDGGLTDRKGAVTILPMEVGKLPATIAHPIAGTLFELADDIAESFHARHLKQQMRMVSFGANLNGRAPKPTKNAAHVTVKFNSYVLWNAAFPILCGKNQVNVNFGERWRHTIYSRSGAT